MKNSLLVLLAALSFWGAPVRAEPLTPVVVSGGSNASLPSGGDYFPAACDGNIYKLVEKTVNAYVVKTYLFIAANGVAVDAWLYTDTNQIIGETHRSVGVHPQYPTLRYWEGERDFGRDSVWVGKVWILVMCHSNIGPSSVEPYAIVYTRQTP